MTTDKQEKTQAACVLGSLVGLNTAAPFSRFTRSVFNSVTDRFRSICLPYRGPCKPKPHPPFVDAQLSLDHFIAIQRINCVVMQTKIYIVAEP